MPRRICLIQGHPDPAGGHFCHALADSYAEAATAAGHEVERLEIAAIAPAPLSSAAEFEAEPEPGSPMAEARAAIRQAGHLVVIFPLWLGTMPALLKAFFEQMARAGFAIGPAGPDSRWPEARLKGRSAHLVVTMGMPALAWRIWFLNAGVSTLRRGILGMSGVAPIRQTTIGMVEDMTGPQRRRWIERMAEDGRAGR